MARERQTLFPSQHSNPQRPMFCHFRVRLYRITLLGAVVATTAVQAAPVGPVLSTSTRSVTRPGGGLHPLPGDTLAYAITVNNTGDEEATTLEFTNPLPVGTTFVPGGVDGEGTPVDRRRRR